MFTLEPSAEGTAVVLTIMGVGFLTLQALAGGGTLQGPLCPRESHWDLRGGYDRGEGIVWNYL